MSRISQHDGNIFNSSADAIVVTVNCLGFMGKGMALECALRYPHVEKRYKDLCRSGDVEIGRLGWVQTDKNSQIVLFPTKTDYKLPSRISYIEDGLENLVQDIPKYGVRSIAIPRLGSELGGLDWNQVSPKVERAFEGIDIQVEMWSFGLSKPDPLLTQLLTKLKSDSAGAVNHLGISPEQLKKVITWMDNALPTNASDLLKIPGTGKVTVIKMLAWAESPTELSLFD